MTESQLIVVDEKNPLIQPFTKQQVLDQIGLMLSGSQLTPQQLILDLCSYLTGNPKVASQARPQDLYAALYQAARHHASFGDGGFWIIPGVDKDDDAPQANRGKGVRVQESKKHIEKCVREGRNGVGRWDIRATLVWADQEITPEYQDGDLVRVEMTAGDPFRDNDINKLKGALVVATELDESRATGPRRRMRIYPKAELDRWKDHSAAARSGKAPAWREDWPEMYRSSARAAMAREICPIRWIGAVGGMVPPQDAIDITPIQEQKALPQSSGAIAKELKSRGEPKVDQSPEASMKPLYDSPWFSDEQTGVRGQCAKTLELGYAEFMEQYREKAKAWKQGCPSKEVWALFNEWHKARGLTLWNAMSEDQKHAYTESQKQQREPGQD